MIKYIDKCLILEEDGERVLVIGDLHIGYDESLRKSGVLVPDITLKETLLGLENVFQRLGKVSKVVLLGDVKHSFGTILRSEWKNITKILDYLLEFSKEVIIIKGNHDVIVSPVADTRNVKVENYLFWKEYAFMHGDKDFDEIYDKKIKYWIVGHAHPAIWLYDGAKKEKFKCFLKGKYKGKEIIILPSFFAGNEGSDPRDNDLGLAWDFKLNDFEVIIVSEDIEVLSFGKLGKLKN